jgi:hypothetical protein
VRQDGDGEGDVVSVGVGVEVGVCESDGEGVVLGELLVGGGGDVVLVVCGGVVVVVRGGAVVPPGPGAEVVRGMNGAASVVVVGVGRPGRAVAPLRTGSTPRACGAARPAR